MPPVPVWIEIRKFRDIRFERHYSPNAIEFHAGAYVAHHARFQMDDQRSGGGAQDYAFAAGFGEQQPEAIDSGFDVEIVPSARENHQARDREAPIVDGRDRESRLYA